MSTFAFLSANKREAITDWRTDLFTRGLNFANRSFSNLRYCLNPLECMFCPLMKSGLFCSWNQEYNAPHSKPNPRLAESESRLLKMLKRKLAESESRRLAELRSLFSITISPRIRSQNRNGSKCSVRTNAEPIYAKTPENPSLCHGPLSRIFVIFEGCPNLVTQHNSTHRVHILL